MGPRTAIYHTEGELGAVHGVIMLLHRRNHGFVDRPSLRTMAAVSSSRLNRLCRLFKSTAWGHTNSLSLAAKTPSLASVLSLASLFLSFPRPLITKSHVQKSSFGPRQRRLKTTSFEALNSHSHAGASHRPPAPPELTLTDPN